MTTPSSNSALETWSRSQVGTTPKWSAMSHVSCSTSQAWPTTPRADEQEERPPPVDAPARPGADQAANLLSVIPRRRTRWRLPAIARKPRRSLSFHWPPQISRVRCDGCTSPVSSAACASFCHKALVTGPAATGQSSLSRSRHSVRGVENLGFLPCCALGTREVLLAHPSV